MNNLLKNDMKTKIVSVLIAILIWLYVSNSSNPFTDKTFYNIPVKIENESFLDENGYIAEGNYMNTTVDVTIRGRKEAVEKIRTSDFEASLDIAQIKSVNDRQLTITEPVCTQNDVTIISYSPKTVNIRLERDKSGSFIVTLNSNVTMKSGYVLHKTTITPDSMQISGKESLIDSVGSIVANLEVKELDRDTTKQLQCKVYNKEGKDISNLLNNDLKVTVKLEVAKEVPVSLVTSGRLTGDYVETFRAIEPETVLMIGSPEVLDKINSIKTEPVVIDNITEDFTTNVSLVVPEGATLINVPTGITVNIGIEKLVVRNVEIAKEDISILNTTNDGSLTYEIKTEKLVIQIKGKQADINSIRAESLNPAVDVAELKEGTHNLNLSVNLPSQIKLVQKATAEILIAKTPETPVNPVTPEP